MSVCLCMLVCACVCVRARMHRERGGDTSEESKCKGLADKNRLGHELQIHRPSVRVCV
jgi:hypothetical protein